MGSHFAKSGYPFYFFRLFRPLFRKILYLCTQNTEKTEFMETKLPENAMRPLKPGETYEPLMPAKANPKEVTAWSVVWGLLMAVIFSAATAYLGLKVGQVFEAAIPSPLLPLVWQVLPSARILWARMSSSSPSAPARA